MRDEEYYEFKPEIDSKERIREVVADASAVVHEQLERWWDKYRISLMELDQQVVEAEGVMRSYLVELGYESCSGQVKLATSL